VLQAPGGGPRLAFQHVDELPADVARPERPAAAPPRLRGAERRRAAGRHDQALRLGATVLLDRTDDPQEPLWVFADPSGHPFCIWAAADGD
jgi:hypothetical protein